MNFSLRFQWALAYTQMTFSQCIQPMGFKPIVFELNGELKGDEESVIRQKLDDVEKGLEKVLGELKAL